MHQRWTVIRSFSGKPESERRARQIEWSFAGKHAELTRLRAGHCHALMVRSAGNVSDEGWPERGSAQPDDQGDSVLFKLGPIGSRESTDLASALRSGKLQLPPPSWLAIQDGDVDQEPFLRAWGVSLDDVQCKPLRVAPRSFYSLYRIPSDRTAFRPARPRLGENTENLQQRSAWFTRRTRQ